MPQSQPPERYQNKFLRILMPLIASDWVSMVLEGWRFIRKLLSRLAQEGMYEILDYDSVLELQDPRVEVTVFKRRQKVKFLQDNIIAYQDYAWGDGNILADYKCSPGVPLDQYQDGFRYNILISLRETKNRGEVVDFNIERTVTWLWPWASVLSEIFPYSLFGRHPVAADLLAPDQPTAHQTAQMSG